MSNTMKNKFEKFLQELFSRGVSSPTIATLFSGFAFLGIVWKTRDQKNTMLY